MPALPLSPERQEDARRLKSAWEHFKENAPGATQETLAADCGWKTQGAVNQYLNGKIPLNIPALLKFSAALKVEPGTISPTLAAQLAPRWRNISAGYTETKPGDVHLDLRGAMLQLATGQGPPGAAGFDMAPALRPFRDVPVVGTVQGGEKGYLLELEHAVGHGDGHITYPARDNQSYAVRVRGDSMRPRIKAGEFIVIEPNHECQPGDDVVVVLKDGQRMVKELLYIRDGEATLGSINNGHPNITVLVVDIEKMHYVAAIIPRGAFYKADK